MNNINLTRSLKNLTWITILTGCLGVLINVIHLDSYKLPVFDRFDSRVFYIGFVFAMIIVAHLIIYTSLFNLKELYKNKFSSIIIITLIKVIFTANLFVVFLLFPDFTNIREMSDFFSNIATIGLAVNMVIVVTLPMHNHLCHSFYKKEESKLSIIMFIIPITIAILFAAISFTFMLIKMPVFKDIVYFQLFFAVVFIMNFSWIVAIHQDEKKGFEIPENTIHSSDRKSRNIFDRLTYFFLFIVITLVLIIQYTNFIYKNLPINKGGGKAEHINLIIEKDTIEGKLIHQTIDYVFIEQDSIIVKKNWDRIDKIINY